MATTINHHIIALQIFINNVINFHSYPRVNSQQPVRNISQTKKTWQSVTAQLASRAITGLLPWRVGLLAWRSITGLSLRRAGLLAWRAMMASSPWRATILVWQTMTEQGTGLRTFSPKIPIFTMFNPKFDWNISIKVILCSVNSFYINSTFSQ